MAQSQIIDGSIPGVLNVGVGLGPRYGGPGMSLEDMWRAVARTGWRVTAATVYRGRGSNGPEAQALAERCGAGYYQRVPHRAVLRWHSSSEQRRWLERHVGEYDLVHLHSLYSFPVFAGATAAARQGVPYILTTHGVLDAVQRKVHRRRKALYDALFARRIVQRARAIVCSSQREMRDVQQAFPDAPVVLVPNGVNLTTLRPLPPADQFRCRHLPVGASPVVLYLGRLDGKKGLDVLIPAFARVLNSCPHACLVLVGGGSPPGFEHEIQRLAESWRISPRLVLTGWLTGEAKLAALAAAEIFVLPSRSESFATAMFEAMGCGLPVVMSKGVDLWPEIEAAGAGLAVELEAGALADAIVTLAQDPVRRRAMSAGGMELAARYSWERTAIGLTAVYRRVISRGAYQPRDLVSAQT